MNLKVLLYRFFFCNENDEYFIVNKKIFRSQSECLFLYYLLLVEIDLFKFNFRQSDM